MQLETVSFDFMQVWTDLCNRKALMQLEMILWEFGHICATGNALKQLGLILFKFGQICATGNAPMLLEMFLCEFG